ncbi:MAG: CADD family putative folate metabolism protein [Pyrinomonadaceae bacterium]
MMREHSLQQRIETAVAEHAMLKHPFYESWSAGKQDQNIIGQYAAQYYAHVKAFPTYVSAVHSRCDDLKVRQLLLENLIEEERGADNHPELWMRFAEGLGVSRAEVNDAQLLPSTTESVSRLKAMTGNEDYRIGIAALYAYESQIPEVAQTKRTGLKEFYGIDDPRTVSFFTVHESADLVHRRSEMRVLTQKCLTDEDQNAAVSAAREAARALWDFLTGVQKAYLPS